MGDGREEEKEAETASEEEIPARRAAFRARMCFAGKYPRGNPGVRADPDSAEKRRRALSTPPRASSFGSIRSARLRSATSAAVEASAPV